MLKTRTRAMLVICLSILLNLSAICFFVDFSYAKYVLTEHDSSSATVANFEIEIGEFSNGDTSYSLSLQNINPSSAGQSYLFKVTNGSTVDNVSQVALSYQITISTTGNLPVDINLKDENSTVLAIVNQTTHSNTCASYFDLNAGYLDENIYSLTLDWDNNYTSQIFAGVMDEIQIIVSWAQID